MSRSFSKDWIINNVLDFVAVLDRCLSETNIAQDRAEYRRNIAMASAWLVRLHQGEAPKDVAEDIVDSQTMKSFTDFYLGGEWGDLQCQALSKLQHDIRSMADG